MSEHIDYEAFDSQPFGFRWGNPRRPGLAYDTPPDPDLGIEAQAEAEYHAAWLRERGNHGSR